MCILWRCVITMLPTLYLLMIYYRRLIINVESCWFRLSDQSRIKSNCLRLKHSETNWVYPRLQRPPVVMSCIESNSIKTELTIKLCQSKFCCFTPYGTLIVLGKKVKINRPISRNITHLIQKVDVLIRRTQWLTRKWIIKIMLHYGTTVLPVQWYLLCMTSDNNTFFALDRLFS